MRLRMTIVPAALVLLLAPSAGAGDAPDPLNGLPPDRAWTAVVAALKARDAKLANLTYTVRERITRVTPGARKPLSDSTVEFRHHPGGDWMHARRTRGDDPAPTFDRVSNWKDGQQRKVIRDAGEGGQPICYVGTNPNTELRSFRFNQVMGLWILEDGPLTSVVDWIEQCARNPKCTVTCTRTEYQGKLAVSVVVAYSEVETRTFWLDPARDWVTLGSDYFGGTPASHNWGTFQVTHAARVDGVWLPMAAFHKSGTTVSPGTGEFEYTVTAAQLGTVKEADLDVPFPAGSIVSDSINRTRYRLEPDGSHTPAPRGRNAG